MSELPLFPLNAVLFPGGRLPLRIFEQRYMDMAKDCLRGDAPFGVCLISEGQEVGAPATPVAVGCRARIERWDMAQLGVLQIVARGEARFRIVAHRAQADGLLRASVEPLGEVAEAPIAPGCAGCVRLLERVFEQQPALLAPPHRFDSSAWVSARLAELLPLPLPIKQSLLEMDDAAARLERLAGFLAAQAGGAEA